ISSLLAQDWDNYDLFLNGSLTAEGRLYTAPEHYDQALCFGFKAYTSPAGRWLVGLTTCIALVLTALDVRLAPAFTVPLLLAWYVLGERARLRANAWEAVEG